MRATKGANSNSAPQRQPTRVFQRKRQTKLDQFSTLTANIHYPIYHKNETSSVFNQQKYLNIFAIKPAPNTIPNTTYLQLHRSDISSGKILKVPSAHCEDEARSRRELNWCDVTRSCVCLFALFDCCDAGSLSDWISVDGIQVP